MKLITLSNRRKLYLTIFGLLTLTYNSWLPGFYTYLDVSQTPQPANAIIVLGGSGGRREQLAVELFKQGYAPLVLISGHAGSMEIGLNLIRSVVPEAALIINDQATSTYDEAQQILILLSELDIQSALIVTDAFHTRRARATYLHVFGDHDIEIRMISPDPEIVPSNWWISKYSDFVVTEYAKMLYYWVAYGVWPG